MQSTQRYAALFCLAGGLAVSAGCEVTVVSQNNGAAAGRVEQNAGGDAREIALTAASAAPARPLDKSFDDIKFPIEKDEPFDRSMLTGNVKDLFGKQIRIRGYMYPTFKRKGINRFVLVRDSQECCFGPGAALYDCVRVTLQEGHAVQFSTTPVAVEGQFNLDEYRDPEGTVRAVFHIEDAVVK
jgi:hypothetical protein